MKSYVLFNKQETALQWLKNGLLFTAPALALFFLQLSQGVELRVAAGVAVLAFYGLLADALKKIGKE